ncbi:MAG: prepilin-type N-terminal cleavage/methylation domain-containing protein [Sedimentisphaerales bacterium]
MNIEHRTQNVELRTASHESRVTRHAFSLTEVLIAIGLLAVGMLFIAGAFPVSIHFTTVATERTIAPIVADEAFAKIKLYGGISYISTASNAEFAYPSTPTSDPNSKQYWWSAISRSMDINDVQVTVFVSRKVGKNTAYYMRGSNSLVSSSRPVPVFVSVSARPGGMADELLINDTLVPPNFINDGYTILDDTTGNIYRVLERYSASPSVTNVIRLDKDWQGVPSKVWVVPPPVNSSRYPCIGVYQKVMRF